MIDFLLLIVAAAAFSLGGLLMKLSAGVSRAVPTAGFIVLFVAGALVQAVAMRRTDLSVSYVVVLGLEAAATVLLGVLVLSEPLPPQRLAAVALIVAGIAWLRTT